MSEEIKNEHNNTLCIANRHYEYSFRAIKQERWRNKFLFAFLLKSEEFFKG